MKSSSSARKNHSSTSIYSKWFSGVMLFVWIVMVCWAGVLYYVYSSKGIVGTETPLERGISGGEAVNLRTVDTQQKKDYLTEQDSKLKELLEAKRLKSSTTTTPVGDISRRPQIGDVKVDPEEGIHVVFSTDCSFFQDWQTIVVFHSAVVVGQRGSITRIASGCDETKKVELQDLYARLYPQYHVHFTPDFKTDGKSKKRYDFYNKPYGVHHWLEHAVPPIADGVVVAIIDPDFIFLRPLTTKITEKNTLFLVAPKKNQPYPEHIGKGTPVSQLYGLGAPWATNNRHFNRTAVCGVGSPCLDVTAHYGELHFSVGPPYLLEKSDLLKLTSSWTEFVPRVYEKYPELLAEMYAYSMAAAHTNLPHLTVLHHMVSNVDVGHGEGWQYIDDLADDTCRPPENGIFYPNNLLPTFVHMCQFYRLGEIGFQKRRFRKHLFDCDYPLLIEPALDFPKLDHKVKDGQIVKMGRTAARRNSFMICAIHRAVNAALIDYRQRMCPDTGFINMNKTVNVIMDD